MEMKDIVKRLKKYRHKPIEDCTGITTQTMRNIIREGSCNMWTFQVLKKYFEDVEGKNER